MDILQQMMNGATDLFNTIYTPDEEDTPYRPNPYGFPEASLNESQRVQEELNPNASGVLVEAAPEIAGAVVDAGAGAIGAIDDMTPDVFDDPGDSNYYSDPGGMLAFEQEERDKTYGANPINPTESVPILPESEVDMGQMPTQERVVQELDMYNQANARKMGELAVTKYAGADRAGQPHSQETEKSFWSMVVDAGKAVGGAAADGLSIGWKQWQNLSPSTRTALVGAAATAYAYHRGWKTDAGNIAKATANMYTSQQHDETSQKSAETIADMNNMGDFQRALFGGNGDDANKVNMTSDERDMYRGQLDNLMPAPDDFFNNDAKMQEWAKQQDEIFNEWYQFIGGKKENALKMPLPTYVKMKQQQAQATHAGAGASVGGMPTVPLN